MSEEGELEKEIKKQPRFIAREPLQTTDPAILIPEGATLLRTKHHHVNFFSGEMPASSQSNGWSEIPKDAVAVRFPNYRPKAGGYGQPEYSRRKV